MGVRKPGYEPKKRNSFTRKRKRIIIISTEGKNKTETNYFKKFNSDKVKIHFARGNATDPVKMAEELVQECEEKDIKKAFGDRAYCLVDSDVDSQKNKQIAKADVVAGQNKQYNMEIIVSGPCFEEWFMCHYAYSTKQYNSNEELLEDVEKHIPDYSKGREDLYELLADSQDNAIKNAKRLEKYCLENGLKVHTAEFQPSTEVYKIIETIRELQNE